MGCSLYLEMYVLYFSWLCLFSTGSYAVVCDDTLQECSPQCSKAPVFCNIVIESKVPFQ